MMREKEGGGGGGEGEGGGEGKRKKSDRIYTTPTQVTKGAVAGRLELETVF